MKKAALFAGIIAALICGTTLAAVISGVSAGSSTVYTTPVPAQYVAASYGSGLANESIAAGTDSALYCAMDNLDGTTSMPECGLNAIRHKGVGPGSTTNYLQATVATTTDIRAASGIWTECFIWRSDSLAAAQGIFSLATGATGRSVSVAATTGAVSYYVMSGGYVAASVGTIRAADTNQFCAGRDSAGKLYWNFNGTAGGGAVYSYTAPVGAQAEFARAGAVALNGHLFEYAFADAEPTPASLAAIWTSVSTCRTRGRCLPDIGTLTAGGTFALVGDDYTIGANWCGDSACSRYVAPVGVVPTREARYSWPALSWAQAGTVPRVATSGLHRQGYGARHASLGPFSAANYVSLGSGLAPDVLDFTGDFTCAMILKPTSFAAFGQPLSNGVQNEGGWFAQIAQTTGAFYWRFATSGSSTTLNAGNLALNETNVIAMGRNGSTAWAQVGGAAAVSGSAGTITVASSRPARIGAAIGADPFAGEISEVYCTTTPATAEYLTYLTDAAMRCTTQGNCFPRDANTVMHCNGDEFTGSVLRCGTNTGADDWTTNGTVTLNAPDFYRNIPSARISAPGAGPYSVGNYFALDPLGTGEDALDFPGSFLVCSTFDSLTLAAGTIVAGGYVAGGAGWRMRRTDTGALECLVATFAGGAGTATTGANAYAAGAMSLGCCGWDQNTDTIYAMLSGSTIATGTKKYQPALGVGSQIGVNNALGEVHNGRVYEILGINKAPTTAQLSTIQRRWLNHQSLTGRTLTNTHTIDTSTYHSAGKVWTRGVNTQRQESAKSVVIQPYVSAGAEVTAHTPVPPGYLISGGFTNAWTQDWILDTNSEGVTLTKNAALAPDGTMTAITIRETATTATHQPYFLLRPAVTGAQAFSASVYIQPVGANNCLRSVFYPNKGTLSPYNTIDIDLARDAQSTYSTYAGAPLNGHEHLADGWIRVWWSTGNATFNAEPNIAIRIQPGSAPCNFVAGGWAGNVNNGFNVWGGQFTYSAATTTAPSIPIYPFCARGATCTAETVTVPNPLRPNGDDWTNLAVQSEDFTTTWILKGGSTRTANAALAPDKSFTADLVTSSGADNDGIYQRVTTAQNTQYTASVWVWTDTGTKSFRLARTNCATWVGMPYTDTLTATTTPQLFSLTFTTGADTCSDFNVLSNNLFAPTAGNYYVWGAQVETGSTPSPYCPTTTAARTCGPGGATGKTVTNLIPYNENLRGTGWSAGAVTVDAATNADGLHLLTPTGSGNYVQTSPGVTVPSTAVVSASAKFQSDAATDVGTLCIYSSGFVSSSACARESGAACAVSSEDGGHSCCASGTFTTTADRISVHCTFGAAATSYFPFVSAGQYPSSNNTIYAGKMQLEPLSASGPYCGPTAAASRTCAPTQRWCIRLKDVNPLNGWAWTNFTSSTHLFDMGTGTANHVYWVPYSTVPFFMIYDGAGLDRYIQPSLTITPGAHTITSCAVDGQMAFYVDGTAYATNAGSGSGVLSAWPSTVTIGSAFDGTIGSIDFNTTGNPLDFPSDRRTP